MDGGGIEIGPARDDELDAVLRLMCAAFGMSYRAARPVYYADPYLNAADKHVLRLHGRIVSCLTLAPTACWIGSAVLPIVGLAGLATHPDHQGHGYAGLLLRNTLQALRARDCALSVLLAHTPDLYLRHGWEAGGSEARLTLSRSALPASSRSPHVRLATGHDVPGLNRCYEREAMGRALHCLRDVRRWRYILSQPHKTVVFAPNGRVEGYLIHEVRPGRVSLRDGGYPPALVVKEFRAASPEVHHALLAHLVGQERTEQVEFVSSIADLRAYRLLEYGGRIETATLTLVRVVDFQSAVRTLCPSWCAFKGRIGLILHDRIVPELSQQVVVTSECNNVRVEAVHTVEEEHSVEGDVGTWSRVIVGTLSGEDACAMGLLNASTHSARALVSRWFPARDPFLPVVDHF